MLYLLYIIYGVLGLLNNLLTIVSVVKFKNLRSATNIFVGSLAVADSPQAFPLIFYSVKNDLIVRTVAEVLFMNLGSINVSLLNILVIAKDRYVKNFWESNTKAVNGALYVGLTHPMGEDN